MAGAMKYQKTPSGADMPMIGLGTWKSKPGEVGNAVKAAIDAGYRHIDCAYVYGNEAEVGAAIKEKIADGTVKREDLFIVSKLWNTRHLPNDVKPSLLESLSNLELEYLDLYLIHWPHCFQSGKGMFPKDDQGGVLYGDVPIMDTWGALEKCVQEGLVRDIGVSNFNSVQVQEIIDKGKIRPAANQVEIHPHFQNTKLVKFCQERGVAMTAYSPLGSPDSPFAVAGVPSILENPQLKELAEKHKKSTAQVILRWLLQRDTIVIPKSVTPSRIQQNFDVLDFKLTDEDMEIIHSLDKGPSGRMVIPFVNVDGKMVFRDRDAINFPFNIEF